MSHALETLINTALNDLGFELVRLRFTGTGKHATLQVMTEPQNGHELTIENCTQISRHLSTILDVEDPIKEAYQLEISSPGMDRPLTREHDFNRFAGEDIKITLKQTRDGQKRYKGQLKGKNEHGLIQLETETGPLNFTFDEIEKAQIDISKNSNLFAPKQHNDHNKEG